MTRSKIGRNELCPCGSKVKFKKCHGMARRFAPRTTSERENFLGQYIDFRMLFGSEANSRSLLVRELREFDIDDSLMVLAKIHYVLLNYYSVNNKHDLIVAR